MLMAGRTRKATAKRKPCGRIVQDILENRNGVAAAKRTLQHLLKTASDPAMGSVAGRMYIMGDISAAEFNACCKLAVLRARADHALGVPARNPRALQYEAARGFSCIADDPNRDMAVIKAWDDAEAAVGLSHVWSVVENVAVYEQPPIGHAEKIAFKEGVARLAAFWRTA